MMRSCQDVFLIVAIFSDQQTSCRKRIKKDIIYFIKADSVMDFPFVSFKTDAGKTNKIINAFSVEETIIFF